MTLLKPSIALFALTCRSAYAETKLTASAPIDYQVIQRNDAGQGRVLVRRTLEWENRE